MMCYALMLSQLSLRQNSAQHASQKVMPQLSCGQSWSQHRMQQAYLGRSAMHTML